LELLFGRIEMVFVLLVKLKSVASFFAIIPAAVDISSLQGDYAKS
jgi:hypothetical protein